MKSINEIKTKENINETKSKETYETRNSTNKNGDDSYNFLLNEINDNIDPLKFCLLFIDIKSDKEKINFYFPIITHLLNIITKIKIIDRESLKDIRHIVLLTLVFIKTVQETMTSSSEEIENQLSNQLYGNWDIDFEEINAELKLMSRPSVFKVMANPDDNIFALLQNSIINQYFIKKESSLKNILESNKNNSKIIDLLTQSIKNYQDFYINILRQYFHITKEMQVTKYEISIFKQCSELILRLQEYSKQDEIPLWVYYLEKLIFYPFVNLKISFEAANLF